MRNNHLFLRVHFILAYKNTQAPLRQLPSLPTASFLKQERFFHKAIFCFWWDNRTREKGPFDRIIRFKAKIPNTFLVTDDPSTA